VGGLRTTTTSHAIHRHFSQFGVILDCAVILDFQGKSRHFGYCKFSDKSSVDLCLSHVHVIDGQNVGVRPYFRVE